MNITRYYLTIIINWLSVVLVPLFKRSRLRGVSRDWTSKIRHYTETDGKPNNLTWPNFSTAFQNLRTLKRPYDSINTE